MMELGRKGRRSGAWEGLWAQNQILRGNLSQSDSDRLRFLLIFDLWDSFDLKRYRMVHEPLSTERAPKKTKTSRVNCQTVEAKWPARVSAQRSTEHRAARDKLFH